MLISRTVTEQAIAHYGAGEQIEHTIEELGELIVAIMELKRNRRSRPQKVQEVINEIADVMIMVEQLAVIFGESEVQRHIFHKVERLKNRIDNEQSEKEKTGHITQSAAGPL
jgi:NTP pyrophosphatase (non-canonical NTP hydrolase)